MSINSEGHPVSEAPRDVLTMTLFALKPLLSCAACVEYLPPGQGPGRNAKALGGNQEKNGEPCSEPFSSVPPEARKAKFVPSKSRGQRNCYACMVPFKTETLYLHFSVCANSTLTNDDRIC